MIYAVDIMEYAQPLVPLVLGLILLFLLIKQSIIRKKLLKTRLIFTFLLVLCCALVLAFYSELIRDEHWINIVQWGLIGADVFISGLYLLLCEISSSKEQFNKDLFLTLDVSKFYVLVDCKNRIREISSKFLLDLDLKVEDVYKKNLFKTIEKKYQIYKLNDMDMSLEDINIFFKSPDTKQTTLNLEFYDKNGDISAYYFTQRPIYTLGRFSGRIFIGDKKETQDLVGMEKNLAESMDELNMIKSRFITILEKTNEGIFFQDLTNGNIWINDVLRKLLCLGQNEISLKDFMSNIHPEDLALVNEKRAMVNNIQPSYQTSYRFNVGHRYIYVKEDGMRITNGKTIEFCGILHLIEGQKMKKDPTLLEQLLGKTDCFSCVHSFYKEDRSFQFVLMKLDAIDKINSEYDRDYGDIVMTEYLKLILNRYVDNQLLYRISGLEFVFIITDYRKMELLKNDLTHGNSEKILRTDVQITSSKTKMDTKMAICYSSDAHDFKELMKKAQATLRICSKEEYSVNYAYYKDTL